MPSGELDEKFIDETMSPRCDYVESMIIMKITGPQ